MSEYKVKSSVNYMAHNLLCYDFYYYSLKVYHLLLRCLLPSFSVSHTPSSCESSSSGSLETSGQFCRHFLFTIALDLSELQVSILIFHKIVAK